MPPLSPLPSPYRLRFCRRTNHSASHAHDTQLGHRSLPTARQPHLLTAHEPTAPAHPHRSPSSRRACTGSAQRPYALEEGSAGAPASQAAALQPTGSPEPEPEPEPGAPTALQPTGGASSSRRLLIATLLCIFCGGLGAHHLLVHAPRLRPALVDSLEVARPAREVETRQKLARFLAEPLVPRLCCWPPSHQLTASSFETLS